MGIPENLFLYAKPILYSTFAYLNVVNSTYEVFKP